MKRAVLLTAALLGACAGKPAVNDGISESGYISEDGVYAKPKPRGLSAEEAATDKNVIGCVKVEYTVRPDGSASDVRILESVPAGYFDARVLLAMEQLRFRPRTGFDFATRTFSFAPKQTKDVLASAAALCEKSTLAPLPAPPEGGLQGEDAPAPFMGGERPGSRTEPTTPRRPTGRR